MAKKKDNKGPSTQSTGTQGVNAVGVNHGTKQVPIAPGFTDGVAGSPSYQQNGPQQVQQLNPGYVSYTTQSVDQGNVPGKKLNVVGVPGATVAPAPWNVQQPVQQGGEQQVQPQTATNVQQNPVAQPVQTTPTNGYTYEQAAEGMKRFHGNVDLYHRPVVSSEAMNKAGYNIPSGNTATVYSMQRGIRDANGNVREVLYTPISADGQVMSQRDIDAYIDSLDGSDDILAADKAGRNMIIHMDANPNGNDGQDLHLMQEAYGRGPQQQGGVQPVQQFAMPQQITYGGKTITLQPKAQPVQQQGQMPQQVTIGNNTYQMPTQTDTNASAKQPNEPTAAQRNAEYEARKQEEAGKQQYNQAVGEYLKAGGNPNAIRQHSDPNMERMQPTAEQVQQAHANAQKPTKTDDDEYVKTLKEYLDSKYESPEDREAREKREARQRKWAAISEGIANVFNVGGSIAGARPAQWKGSVGELYANQEAEADKRRAEYRQALMDLNAYKTAIRNGNIAEARAIEERRKNDFYERKMLEDIASKQANDELKKQKQEADIKRNDQQQANRNAESKAKLEGRWNPSGNAKGSSKSGGGGTKKSSGRGRSGGSRATGAQAAKSAKAAAKRRAKAATQGTKFGKK